MVSPDSHFDARVLRRSPPGPAAAYLTGRRDSSPSPSISGVVGHSPSQDNLVLRLECLDNRPPAGARARRPKTPEIRGGVMTEPRWRPPHMRKLRSPLLAPLVVGTLGAVVAARALAPCVGKRSLIAQLVRP